MELSIRGGGGPPHFHKKNLKKCFFKRNFQSYPEWPSSSRNQKIFFLWGGGGHRDISLNIH